LAVGVVLGMKGQWDVSTQGIGRPLSTACGGGGVAEAARQVE